MKQPKTKKQLLTDPRVLEYWYEDGEDRPHWVGLKDGYNCEGRCTVNGRTIKQVCEEMELVEAGDTY